MRENRAHSILYGVLAGFALFGLFAGWVFTHIDWNDHGGAPMDHLFPDGTQLIEQCDSHGGFHGDGVAFLAVQIPPGTSAEFASLLQESGFTDMPLPEDIQYKLRIDPETCMAADIPNSLWWFEDQSPADCLGKYTNYTFHAYDPDNAVYYFIESDS